MQIFIWRTLREKVTVKSGEKEERETRPGTRRSRDETEHGKEVSWEESAEIFASVSRTRGAYAKRGRDGLITYVSRFLSEPLEPY